MADNKKYYYLKLKDNFFESDELILLESMPDGILYSNVLLKLYLRSLKNDGKLMLNERIPYNSTMLSSITRQPVAVVEKAVKTFSDLGMIEVLDNGAIYMLDIQNFIGESSTEAERIREYRNKIKLEKIASVQMYEKSTPEIEREIDKDIEIDIKEKKKKTTKFVPPTIQEIKEYCLEKNINVDADQFFNYFEAGNWVDSKGNKVKSWKQKLLTWNKYSTPAKKEFTGYTQEGHKVEDYSNIIDF